MTTAKLTDGFVAGFDTPKRELIVWDEALARFGVRISTTGGRFYLVQYRPKGEGARARTARRITIGQHDGALWNVTKARAAARRILAQVDLGQDPFADRQAEREARLAAELAAKAEAEAKAREAEARKAETFNALLDLYVTRKLSRRRSRVEAERLLRTGPAQKWGERHVSEIGRKDLALFLEELSTRSQAVGHATYAELGPFFAWCLDRDVIPASPLAGVRRPSRPQARERVLLDEELRLIWTATEGRGYPFGPLFKLLILTGQRRGEVTGMDWAELDLEAGIWRIPGERTKNGQAHEIDLSPEALQVLKDVKALGLPGGQVFQGRGAGGQVTGFSAAKRALVRAVEALRRKEAAEAGEDPPGKPLPHWTLHDLRRTVATGMNGLDVPPHVVERVLNHITNTKSGLVGVYQRHEYRPQRKAALLAWGSHVAAVLGKEPTGGNVVRLRA
ncbi:site-specific integrase [Phenylobacterium sp.]|uniref:tyrosine-type recombinase/integrase n=1 Tax=Phenylobacterium sp. TaxID=1871053 RepID=UPI0025F1413C|nr:site-specific integrase [Phenylobacterium sp.]MCA3741992.1 tyrosine-type recombinase/integrase [Phenylobacterium sp.]